MALYGCEASNSATASSAQRARQRQPGQAEVVEREQQRVGQAAGQQGRPLRAGFGARRAQDVGHLARNHRHVQRRQRPPDRGDVRELAQLHQREQPQHRVRRPAAAAEPQGGAQHRQRGDPVRTQARIVAGAADPLLQAVVEQEQGGGGGGGEQQVGDPAAARGPGTEGGNGGERR
ncbi:hypothetical protein [Lysobacter enzymogenes]|uniref:hypothetical protein n=1 Tax=Lysobacter enzymogenes TaxID=69 RepID=UPI000F4BABBE|nr:hypothetical protein [Lysobacter enzymogenes]